ncbi:PDR/VanB family oxidoreductase [Cupriavidus necator]|uniref:PDR/VanB family oxidoreductase n=1 Tax=Cupriavidus necator TaxID=106590 RepID=UPI001872A18B|nr:PDR/VanB family oxidoreductase [Cupriavidus necator]MDX6007349.1 PDR/VanB family oxidoreductase [Cupriavidus necator]
MSAIKTLRVLVTRRTQEAEDIISLELRDPDGGMLSAFSAGSHIDVHAGPDLVRQYSLCNSPTERDRYVIGVLRDPSSRGGSAAVHDQCIEGAALEISEPRNHFPLHAASRSILIAGGIGVTPMLSMAEALHATGGDFTFHYCTRSATKTAFRPRIEHSAFARHVRFHHDDGGDEQKLDLARLFARVDTSTHVYVCGPTGFIDWICRGAAAAGLTPNQVHFEYFGAKEIDSSNDSAFDVKIASSGEIFRIPIERSVISVLQEAGIDILTSCGEGTCGTCVTRVLEGVPDHRDVFLTDDERASGDQFTPCCSRAKTPLLVLDL